MPGPLKIGQKFVGYVRAVRPDGKIDLTINPAGYGRVAPLKEHLLEELRKAGGSLAFGDASSPEDIRRAFGVSKKSFKQALGALYRERLITIGDRVVRLSKNGSPRG